MNNEVSEVISKLVLCVLPTQFGKTFTAMEKINTEFNEDHLLGRSLHIVHTMNTLLNNTQFASRVEHEFGKGSVCVFSSIKKNKKEQYTHVGSRIELQGLCIDEEKCPLVVIMCSNSQRYGDATEFLKVINKNKTLIDRVFVYYDELHKYINDSVRSQIEEIHSLDIVNTITGLSATPDRIWQPKGFWSNISIIQLDTYNDKNYAGCDDMVFNCIDNFFPTPSSRSSTSEKRKQSINFIENVLRTNPEILGDGTRSFIPAHNQRSTHNGVRELLFNMNDRVIVVVLNGVEKTLQYKDGYGKIKTLLLGGEDVEVCETISRRILEHNLQFRPLVITGLLCVGMGQTLTHRLTGSFTSAIFGQVDFTPDNIYQLFGRVTGRMKDWTTYTKTQIYCPTSIMNHCYSRENCAKNTACEHNGEVISRADYREPMIYGQFEDIHSPKKKKMVKAETNDKDYKVFDTQVEAITFGKSDLNTKFRKKTTHDAPKALQKNGLNPTCEELINRMWGLSDKNLARMVPIQDGKWCVYWRPSMIKQQLVDEVVI